MTFEINILSSVANNYGFDMRIKNIIVWGK